MDKIDGQFAAWLIINHANWPLPVRTQVRTTRSGQNMNYYVHYGQDNASTIVSSDELKWLEMHRMIRAN